MVEPEPTPQNQNAPENRNLPVPVTAPADDDNALGLFTRWWRAWRGWRSGSIRADLKDALEAGTPLESGFTPQEGRMLRNILGLRERRIADVMVPRADIIAVQQDIQLAELMKVFEKAGHSRLVVYNDTLDDPVGMIHIRDVIVLMTAQATVNPKANAKRKKPFPAGLDFKAVDLSLPLVSTGIIRPMLFVPPSMPAIDLLAKMQATRIHLGLVVDEYGGTDGIVSIEDVVEQIVGEIEDEHDEDEAPSVVRQADGSFVADARASLDDVTAIVGQGFDVGDVAKEVDTLGGYLVTRVGRVPLRGELVQGPAPFEIEVLDADPRRVKRVKIHRGKERRPGRGAPPLAPGLSEQKRADPSSGGAQS